MRIEISTTLLDCVPLDVCEGHCLDLVVQGLLIIGWDHIEIFGILVVGIEDEESSRFMLTEIANFRPV